MDEKKEKGEGVTVSMMFNARLLPWKREVVRDARPV
jgi:hypothetical protein